MTMCRVELKDIQKAVANHAAILKDADEKLEIALIQYKANYKYSLWERLTGVTKFSASRLWCHNNDSYWYSDPMETLVSLKAAIAASYRYHKLQRVCLSGSDDIYLSGDDLKFYVLHKDRENNND